MASRARDALRLRKWETVAIAPVDPRTTPLTIEPVIAVQRGCSPALPVPDIPAKPAARKRIDLSKGAGRL